MKIFDRGTLTEVVLDHLRTGVGGKNLPLGDGVAPAAGGWIGGQPGEGAFVPYLVLMSSPASPQAEAIGNRFSRWAVPYQIRSFGASRQQADWSLDLARNTLVTLIGEYYMLPARWGISNMELLSIGGATRNDSTNPPYFESTDSVSLWLEC